MLASETTISIPGVIYRPIAGEILPFFAISSPKNDILPLGLFSVWLGR